jgi:hypothetical protein
MNNPSLPKQGGIFMDDKERISYLTDQLRIKTGVRAILVSDRFLDLSGQDQIKLLSLVRSFNFQSSQNVAQDDSNHGLVRVSNMGWYWKFEDYQPGLRKLSDNPAWRAKEIRILTINPLNEFLTLAYTE